MHDHNKEVEKAFNKIQYSFLQDKVTKKLVRADISVYNKAMYDKTIAKIILHREKLITFPLQSGKRQGSLSTLSTLIQYSTGSFSKSNKTREAI